MGADTAKGNVLHFMLHTAANVHVFSQNGLIFGGRWPGWPSLEVTKLCMLREIKVKRLWMQTHTHTQHPCTPICNAGTAHFLQLI